MSSASSYAYRVREEELRRQRELAAARAALRAAEARFELVRRSASEQRQTWGDSVDVIGAHGVIGDQVDVASLREATRRIEGSTKAAREKLDEQVIAARIETLRAGFEMPGRGTAGPTSAGEAIERARRERSDGDCARAATEADDEEEVAVAIPRIVAKLDAEASADAFAAVRAEAEDVLAVGSARGREQALGALRLRVQEANQATRDARERRAGLERMAARLHGFDGPEANAARRLLAAARDADAPPPPGLEAKVEAAIQIESRSQETEYVAAQLQAALSDLGYDLGPDFETTLLSEGFAQFGRADWPGYAVRVRSGGDPPRINFNVVRGTASRPDQAARDVEVEQQFCDGQPHLFERLGRVGIDATRTRVVEPGTMELQKVEGLEQVGGDLDEDDRERNR